MLTHLLHAQDCAACRLCCHFQRSSAWETPAIEPELVTLYREMNPPPPLTTRADGSVSFALNFPPDDEGAEAPCPMLDPASGCMLPRSERPFECRLWPLRLMRLSSSDELGASSDLERGSGDGSNASSLRDWASEHPEGDLREGAASGKGRVVLGCYKACPGVPASLLPRLRAEALGPLRTAIVEHAGRLPQTIRPFDAHYCILAEIPELNEV